MTYTCKKAGGSRERFRPPRTGDLGGGAETLIRSPGFVPRGVRNQPPSDTNPRFWGRWNNLQEGWRFWRVVSPAEDRRSLCLSRSLSLTLSLSLSLSLSINTCTYKYISLSLSLSLALSPPPLLLALSFSNLQEGRRFWRVVPPAQDRHSLSLSLSLYIYI